MIAKREHGEILLKNIEAIEKRMLEEPQIPCPVIHRFGPGIYMRELTVPSGTLVVGHHQNFDHTNIFLKGRVKIIQDDGTMVELKAPMIFTGKPGRKIGYVLEDMVWMNVYATDEIDVEKLEAHFLTKTQGFLDAEWLRMKMRKLQAEVDREDFQLALRDLGASETEVRAQSVDESDLDWLPRGCKTKLANSAIEGRGLFATSDIESGELIMPARVDGRRTTAGRFTNHAKNPNAKMVRGPGTNIDLIATRSILGCHGGMDGQEITIDYRESVKLTLELAKEAEKCQV